MIPNQLNTPILNYFSVGGVWQNILFYVTIFCLLYINIFLTRRKKSYKLPLTGNIPGEKDELIAPVADIADKNTLHETNTTLNEEMAGGLNDQLSEISAPLELPIAGNQSQWDWSLDFSSRELTLSEYGLQVHGFPENTKPILNEAIIVVDPRHRQAVIDAIERSFKTGADFSMSYFINPLNSGRPREIKSTAKVQYNEQRTPEKLSGTFALTHTEP
ncbi:hypothetical protein SNE26_22985 [Mucilaginibacter sp. cycad4]|uniref:hypothetical protein n=1 Tax=Mucilaginibacter sp. cycad4 TaxID=3342096 RepID=UPI002AAB8BAD|nr:hypothetical protein [Mucilaginibacter gossypii]WPU98883.1 hypothetical protein SNE26_22985 [Mucilaginibacter gossypii]